MKAVSLLAPLVLIASFVSLPAPSAYGQDATDALDRARGLEQRIQDRRERGQASETIPDSGQTEHLDEHKQRVCERRQALADKRVEATTNLLNTQQQYLDLLFEKLETFASEQELTFRSYRDLVDDAKQNQSQSQRTLELVELTPIVFDCTEDNYHAAIFEFKDSVQESVSGLKDYRDSLKDLLQGVRDALLEERT